MMPGGGARDRPPAAMQDYMINWNVGPLGLVLRPDLGADMPPVVAQVLPGESVASLAGVAVGDMLVSVNSKKTSKLGYDKAMRLLYKQKLPIILHFRIPQFKTMAAQQQQQQQHEYPHLHAHHNLPFNPSDSANSALVAYNTSVNSMPYDQQQARPGQFLQHQRMMTTTTNNNNNSELLTPSRSSRGGRTMSMLSTSHETKEQKLKKQFSAVWESGSLGFSFRPYAPGVNIPTVDLIGARGKGKNMDVVCVNDVLIAINGDKTQHLGVERVLKMLHVLEKPVVLRFHKSSHRIDTPVAPPPRRRRKSSLKLPAVDEAQHRQDQQEEEGDEEEENGGERGSNHVVGVLQEEEEAMPSVRFALDDQIQLRSDSRAHRPQPMLTPTLGPSAVAAASTARRLSRAEFPPPRQTESPPPPPPPQPVANPFASRVSSSPAPLLSQRHIPAAATVNGSHRTTAPPPPPPPPQRTEEVAYEDIGPSVSEPDVEGNDPHNVEGPPVKISVAGTKRAAPSFVIPLEHARQIVAKSAGKPVEQCEFGGVRLLEIKEGSVQARLLVTFAKACLAKQMQQARGEDEGVVARPPHQQQQQQQPHGHTTMRTPQPYSSAGSQSSGRKSNLSSGRRSANELPPASQPQPQHAGTFEGNTLAPGRPKYLTYSFRQTQGARAAVPAPVPAASQRVYLALPPSEAGSMETHHYSNADYDPSGSSVSRQVEPSLRASLSSSTAHDVEDFSRSGGRATEPYIHMPPLDPTQQQQQQQQQRSSEPGRVSAGGLTLSQLRVSGKHDVDGSDKFRDLGEVIESTDESNSELPKRVTEMIALDTLLALRVDEQASAKAVPFHEEEEETKEETIEEEEEPVAEPDLSLSSSIEGDDGKSPVAVAVALPSHPIVERLCADSRDLALVLVGRALAMIVAKAHVIEEIQDILDSLEMELQFERHSHVGVGRGSMLLDEPPSRSCSRCGKRGDLADLALDSDRRELYCTNCWGVFFYHDSPPAFDSPAHFDTNEYSLHDSMVNVADSGGFHPWRRLHADDAQRDSNVTVGSSITEHADEVWL